MSGSKAENRGQAGKKAGCSRRRRWKTILILAAAGVFLFLCVFFLTAAVTGLWTRETVISTGRTSLPVLEFYEGEEKINLTEGTVQPADPASSRSTLLPVASPYDIKAEVVFPGETKKIDEAVWYILDAKGEERSKETQCTVEGESKNMLTIASSGIVSAMGENQEEVLVVRLTVGGENIYYQTRIKNGTDVHAGECLAFAKEFQQKALAGNAEAEIAGYLETDQTADTSGLSDVSIHSSAKMVSWNGLSVTPPESVQWIITDSNSVYTNVVAGYDVQAKDGDTLCRFRVREYFRVRSSEGKMYLLNYDRKAQQYVGEESLDKGKTTILAGLGDAAGKWTSDEEGNFAAITSAGEVWQYNAKDDHLKKIYDDDRQSQVYDPRIQLLTQSKEGDLVFARYGYVSRGRFEGRTGIGVLYYDSNADIVLEKAFIPYSLSEGALEVQSGLSVFYSQSQNSLYALVGEGFYEVNLSDGRQKQLAKELNSSKYTVSSDGSRIAYLDEDGRIHMRGLDEKEEETVLNPPDKEEYTPIGYMGTDLAVGVIRPAESGKDSDGNDVSPMYAVEIYRKTGEKLQTYTKDNRWILSAGTEGSMMTLHLAKKDGTTYTAAGDDYFTGNESSNEQKVQQEEATYERRGKVSLLKFSSLPEEKMTVEKEAGYRVEAKSALMEEETDALAKKMLEGGFYLFTDGRLDKILYSAAEAVREADEEYGFVTMTDGTLLWERGNRDLSYEMEDSVLENIFGSDRAVGSDADKIVSRMEKSGRRSIPLSGCSVSQILFFVNRDMPVMWVKKDGTVSMIIGYTQTDLICLDGADGARRTIGLNEVEDGSSFTAFAE